MEVYLVTDTIIQFKGGQLSSGSGCTIDKTATVAVHLFPVEDSNSAFDYCFKLGNSLIQNTPTFKQQSDLTPHTLNWKLDVTLSYGVRSVTGNKSRKGKDLIQVSGNSTGNLLERFRKVCGGKENVKLELGIRDFGVRADSGSWKFYIPKVSCKDMEIKCIHLNSKKETDFGCEKQVQLSEFMQFCWSAENTHEFIGRLTIKAVLNEKAVGFILKDNTQEGCIVPRKILEDAVASDAVIVASNGAPLKCHKSFLAVHSKVLKTMFESDLDESKSCTIQMPDMSEASVKAFLLFLYCSDVESSLGNCVIAFELLYAGHKYDILSLEEAMKDIFLLRSSPWFTVDVAVRLFVFSRNVDHWDNLVNKSVRVLKSKSTVELNTSVDYQHLFTDHPQAAMELCNQFKKQCSI